MITKPFSRFFILFLFFFAANITLQAQKKKAPNFSEGVITYDLKIGGDKSEEIAPFIKGSTIQFFIKDSSTCLDILFMNGLMHVQFINNATTKANFLLLDIPFAAEKIAVQFPKKDDANEDNQLLDRLNNLEQLKDTPSPLTFKGKKRIAKYKCRKGTMDIPTSENVDFSIYSTDKIRPNSPNAEVLFHLLGGFPLGLNFTVEGMTFELFAKNIEKKAVPSTRFDIPKGYTEKDFDEFQELFKDKIGTDKIIGL